MPLVTVNIPTYRRDEMLRRAIDSALTQSVTDIEVNVSDNANLSLTRDIVESFGDSRLTYSPNASNLGLHGNLTRCLHLGSAPFVQVLPDDDRLYPRSLERRLEAMQRFPSAALVHTAFDYIDADGRVIVEDVNWSDASTDRFESGAEFIQRTMQRANRIGISTALFRRTLVATDRFDPRDGGYTDMVLWMRLALRGDVVYLHERLSGIAVHPEADSSGEGWYAYDEDGRPAAGRMSREEVRLVVTDKLRFIDESLSDRAQAKAARRAAHKHARHQLTSLVAASLGKRPASRVLRDVAEIVRDEPSLLLTPWPAVLGVSAVVGRTPYDWLVARRSR